MPRLQLIKQFILENFLFSGEDSALGDTDSLISGGIIDSTGIIELISYLEDQFGIRIDASEMVPANFETLQSIDAFVTKKSSG